MGEHTSGKEDLSLNDLMRELCGLKMEITSLRSEHSSMRSEHSRHLEALNSVVQSHGRQIADLSVLVTDVVLTRFAKKTQGR